MAIGGVIAVFIAVFNAIIVLPAVLQCLKNRIDFLPFICLDKTKIGALFFGIG